MNQEAEQRQELMDELEAGEAAVEYDDKEPQEVLAWTIERFGDRMGICSSFQADGCVLIDMAWRIDPQCARVHDRHRPDARGNLSP